MTVLLDTHALLWLVLDDAKLSIPAKTLLEDPATVALVSVDDALDTYGVDRRW